MPGLLYRYSEVTGLSNHFAYYKLSYVIKEVDRVQANWGGTCEILGSEAFHLGR
jgi:hypothetical protein